MNSTREEVSQTFVRVRSTYNLLSQTRELFIRAPLRLALFASAMIPDRQRPILSIRPDADPHQLSRLSRVVNRALVKLKPYLADKVRFDRRCFDADAPALCAVPEFDAEAVLAHRVLSSRVVEVL